MSKTINKKVTGSFGVTKIHYDTETHILSVDVLNHGSTPQQLKYGGVPLEVFREFSASPSKGGYFNSSIRNKYQHLSTQDI